MDALHISELELTPEAFHSRMREAKARGQPFFPWNDVSPEEWRESLVAIGAAVSRVLAADAHASVHTSASPAAPCADRPNDVSGSAPGPMRSTVSSEAPSRGSSQPAPVHLHAPRGARALGIAAFTSGTGPLLGYWIESGRVTTDPASDRLLRLHLDQGRRRILGLRASFEGVVDLLAVEDVVPTVIKGFHTAHGLFPEPGTRPMSDLDMVVAPDQLGRVSAALLRAGFVRGRHLRRPYMAEWSPPGGAKTPRSLDLTHEANPWTLDLHVTFKRDYGGVRTISVVPLQRGRDEVTEPCVLAERDVRVLAQPYLTAYLAAHASQELRNLTLVRLIELVWAVRAMASGSAEGRAGAIVPNLSGLEDLLVQRRATGYVYPAFELAERLAPGTLPPSFRELLTRTATPRVRRVVDRLEPATAQRLDAVSLEEQFMWANGPFDHLRRIRRALWPSWAGSFPEMFQVQTARARQLFRGRVAVSRREPPTRS